MVDLPTPRRDGMRSLEAALSARRSARAFTPRALTPVELSQLLWAAQGMTGRWGGRTAPSAGALYPLEVRVATAAGLFHYGPTGHRLVITSARDVRAALARAALAQEAVAAAPAVFAITAGLERTAGRYGARADRYVMLEAGHAAQNLLLQATALGLGGVPIGAFNERNVRRVLGLPAGELPLYLLPVGEPTD